MTKLKTVISVALILLILGISIDLYSSRPTTAEAEAATQETVRLRERAKQTVLKQRFAKCGPLQTYQAGEFVEIKVTGRRGQVTEPQMFRHAWDSWEVKNANGLCIKTPLWIRTDTYQLVSFSEFEINRWHNKLD